MNEAPVSHSSNPVDSVWIEGWHIDPSTLCITRDRKTVKLQPRAMAVLMFLASRSGETISREELEREVWQGQIVVYEALSNTIAKLRKAFDEDPHEPRIIQTIQKVGYRLIAEVSRTPEQGGVTTSDSTLFYRSSPFVRWSLGAGAAVLLGSVIAISILWSENWTSQDEPSVSQPETALFDGKQSIAVLPFTNMSGDAEQEYFADGMTDDLITDLSKISGLLVISRNSTFKYKGSAVDISRVAQEFGVRFVLEGSVRRDGERLRINTQLIDASTGGHIWAERFDRPVKDIFAVQDSVVNSIVAALSVRLTAEEKNARREMETDDPDAYTHFLRGQAHIQLARWQDFAAAIVNFKKALELDPNYTRIYGALAEVYWHIWSDGYSTELGMSQEENFEKMEHYLAKAMEQPIPTTQAQHIYSRYLTKKGRFEEALAAAERLIALNPGSEIGYRALGRAANKAGRPAQGLEAMKKARRVNPRGDDVGAYAYRIAESYFLLGMYEDAEVEFQEYRRRSGDTYFSCMMLAGVYAQLGRTEEARAHLDKFKKERAKKGKSPHTLATFDEWAFVPSVRKRYVESLRKAGMPPGD